MTQTLLDLNTMNTFIPSKKDALLAGESTRAMAVYLKSTKHPVIKLDNKIIALPKSALKLLAGALNYLAHGSAVTLVPVHTELGTQEAANMLNVSRPHLVKLLDSGKIPHHKVGKHRRVLMEDVLNYKNNIDQARLKTLAKLTEEAQKLNMGY
jgi:excisionase family DNA binding protein